MANENSENSIFGHFFAASQQLLLSFFRKMKKLVLNSIISVLVYLDTMRSADDVSIKKWESSDLIVSKYSNTEIIEYKASKVLSSFS